MTNIGEKKIFNNEIIINRSLEFKIANHSRFNNLPEKEFLFKSQQNKSKSQLKEFIILLSLNNHESKVNQCSKSKHNEPNNRQWKHDPPFILITTF
jgi:hypothetical protein